jgi:hypothetical protein
MLFGATEHGVAALEPHSRGRLRCSNPGSASPRTTQSRQRGPQ